MINRLNQACFGFDDTVIRNIAEGHMFGAVELGQYVVIDNNIIVGIVYVYKRISEYDGEEFYIDGLGGLGVLPEYQGKGYARKLVESALQMSYDIGGYCLFIYRRRRNCL